MTSTVAENLMYNKTLKILTIAETAKTLTNTGDTLTLIREAMKANVPIAREHLPTELAATKEVWTALLMTRTMGITALIRNVGNMSKFNVFDNIETVQEVQRVLCDAGILRRGRIHPLTLLIAWKVYEQGSGMKGGGTWNVNRDVLRSLARGFEMSFDAVDELPVGIDMAIDVSGSMTGAMLAGTPVTCAQAAAVMAMVAAKKWQSCGFYAFSTIYANLRKKEDCVRIGARKAIIHDGMSLDSILNATKNLHFSGTDCSLPMIEALKQRRKVQAFIVITDSDTGSYGKAKPVDALREYRRAMKVPDAMLIVIALTCNKFTIADKNDPYMLDICGFDPGFMQTVETFIRTKGFTSIASGNQHAVDESVSTLEATFISKSDK